MREGIFKHLVGFSIFGVIVLCALVIGNIERFPFIASKLPMRHVITAKHDLKLYSTEYENGNKRVTGILSSGETVDFEAWVCPYKEIKLSNGERYLILAEQNEGDIEMTLLKFYYF